jgi:UNC-50 family
VHSTSIVLRLIPLPEASSTTLIPMSGPHISIPRPYGGSTNFGSTAPDRRRSEIRMPRFFKRSALLINEMDVFTRSYTEETSYGRLFKFPQMDFEMAIWEMTHLMYAPKKVFKSIYYHKRNTPPSIPESITYLSPSILTPPPQKPKTPGTAPTPPSPTSSPSSFSSPPSPGPSPIPPHPPPSPNSP